MFMSTLSRLLSAWFAFILPCYATFKALSRRPLSEPDLQKLAMYWAVIGAFVAFEYLAEWLISWLPFYWEAKTAFLLFLSLPQTQGSTYIYLTYLHPFLTRNESELDAGILALNRNVLSFLQAKLTALWEFVAKKGPQQGQPAQPSGQNPSPLSWLTPELVRSAWNMVNPNAGAQAAPANFRQNSNGTPAYPNGPSPGPSPRAYEDPGAAPPFPVPQHFKES